MKKKILLLIVLLLIVVSGATIYYFFEAKEKTKDKQVDEVIKSGYSIQLPSNGTPSESNTANSIYELEYSNSGVNSETSQDNENTLYNEYNSDEVNKNTQTNPTISANPSLDQKKSKKDKPTVESINKKYEPSFQELQTQANVKVDKLISIALEEYNTKKKNGEKISYPYFYSKYVSAAKLIEMDTDLVFDQIYDALSIELVQSGFTNEDAKTFQEQYNNEKKARKAAILKRAKDALN